MTSRQKLIIAILAIIDIIVILALVALTLRPSSPGTLPLSTPMLVPSQQVCQWEAAQMLSQIEPGGAVVLTPDGLLNFEIIYSLLPGETADEAAQLVWTAFDVALALRERECELTGVKVTILAQGDRSDTRIRASVSAIDLVAFDAGELSEDEFIERVTYTTSPLPR